MFDAEQPAMRPAEISRPSLRLTHARACSEAGEHGAHDEDRLVRAAREDAAAFEELYRRHYGAVVAHIGRRTGDRQATEDLVAEVFRTALERIGRYRSRGVPFRFWLLRIAALVVKRHWRNVRKHRDWFEALPAPADMPSPEQREDAVDREALRQALARLPHRWQTALSLVHLDGLTVEEAAQVLRCRPGTVKSRLSRGRSELRRILTGGTSR